MFVLANCVYVFHYLLWVCFLLKWAPGIRKQKTLALCNWYYVQILSKSRTLWADIDAHLCRLYGTEPLPELKLYCQLNSVVQTHVNFIKMKYVYFLLVWLIWEYRLQNDERFIQAWLCLFQYCNSNAFFGWEIWKQKESSMPTSHSVWIIACLLKISTAWQISNQPWSSKTPHAETDSLHRGKRWVLY